MTNGIWSFLWAMLAHLPCYQHRSHRLAPSGRAWLFLLMIWTEEHSMGRKMPWRAARRGLTLLLRRMSGLVQTSWLGLQKQRFLATKTFPKSCIF